MTAFVYCDGSYRREGGQMIGQTGWVVVVFSDPPLIAKGHSGQKTTIKNSESAEWRAVFDAATWLRHVSGLTELFIRSDLKDLVAAINGTGGGASGKGRAAELKAKFEGVDVSAGWIPRQHNGIADGLSRKVAGK